ncbi:hypothetical protein FOG50_03084 [Hanseniaspora uvarum]|jgi:putative transcription factor|uniref:Multiprotein-bridging factor 1 n=1 Tax=Hanseniaspora uvarum TaxID=29833 RepID=A0A1E5RQT8_HANUV|nr:hypothetical protein FOG50_03084 [Hanseniaspora uvarum]OEJ89188.1 Multiprotein-bridging factor 1 [Hanseniaspora uvarum]GMM42763.1 multiprotein-bridging factor 1 [Hanseniaspora uvarum]
MSDWDSEVIIGKKARIGGGGPRANVAKSQSQINAARRSGLVVGVEKKYNFGNKKGDVEGQRLTMIDRSEGDIIATKKLDPAIPLAMQKARQEKGLSQKELANKANEKPNVVNEYETGKAIPNQQTLSKFERVLGVKLRGKDIGSSLFKSKK